RRRPRRHATPGVHADGEGRAEWRRIVRDHHGDLELIETLSHHRHADEAAPVLGHEVDGLGRHPVRGHQEVTLVLPILVVYHHEDASGADLLDGLLDLHEVPIGPVAHAVDPPRVRNRCTYLPIISISRFTRRPGLSAPSVVCPSVCGISMISKPVASSPATVRLTPSTVTDPCGMRRRASAGSCHSTRRRAVSPSRTRAVTVATPSTCP